MIGHLNNNKRRIVRHWMAVGAAALLATGISLANMEREPQRVLTTGLPLGWKTDGLAPGLDQVGVNRPDGDGRPELVVRKYRDAPGSKPLAVYQTIDAARWRGRTIVYKFLLYTHLEPEVMQRIADAPVSETRIECDGTGPGSRAYINDAWRTRTWLESNLRLKVPDDATRCSFGLTAFVRGEFRLSRLHLKDDSDERDAYLAKRGWPKAKNQSMVTARFPTATGSSGPNLELEQ